MSVREPALGNGAVLGPEANGNVPIPLTGDERSTFAVIWDAIVNAFDKKN